VPPIFTQKEALAMHPVLHRVPARRAAARGTVRPTPTLRVPRGEQGCTLPGWRLAPLRLVLTGDCDQKASCLPVRGSTPVSTSRSWVLRPACIYKGVWAALT